jgi:hypothetical protein
LVWLSIYYPDIANMSDSGDPSRILLHLLAKTGAITRNEGVAIKTSKYEWRTGKPKAMYPALNNRAVLPRIFGLRVSLVPCFILSRMSS